MEIQALKKATAGLTTLPQKNTTMKVLFFFFIYLAAAFLSAAGVNNDLVAFTGSASGLTFSALVMHDLYHAWITCDNENK